MHDIKLAARSLSKTLGFSITAVLMLAFGIGGTTAIFSIVEGVLLRPLPFPDASRVVVVGDHLEGSSWGEPGVTAPEIGSYTRGTQSFVSLGGYQQIDFELSGGGEPSVIHAARMSEGVFRTLETAPLLGRAITRDDDEKRQQVAVLSYGAWRSRFHADRGIVGAKILLDRKPYIVVGVMPRGFEFPLLPGQLNHSELWVPLSLTQEELTTGVTTWSFEMVGRLRPGVTAAQAFTDAQRVAEETMRNYPSFARHLHIVPVVTPLQESTVREARPLVSMLFLAVTVVLLLACVNLAGLLLVRSIRRQREIAIRRALGARAPALLRQPVTERLVLSATGGLLGLALAAIAVRAGVGFLPETLPRVSEIGLNWLVVSFALALAVLIGVLCGVVPALAAMRANANEAIKEGGRTGTMSGGQARLRSALVVAQIAIALVLLAASGVLLRSFEKMRAVDLGFHPDHVLTASYSLPQKQYLSQASVDEFNDELIRRIQQLPGVKSVGLTSFLPASGNNSNSTFIAEGYVPPKGANMNLATPIQLQGDYLQAMGIALQGGRFFTPEDKANTQLLVIVNHKLADHYWPGLDPIGKRLRMGMQETQTPWMTIVGEVADVKEGSPDAPDKEQWYQPIEQVEKSIGALASPTDLNGNGGYITVRTAMEPEQMENVLRATVRSIDPQLPLAQVQSMAHAVSDSEAPRRFNTALISAFGIAAVLLAALGIYSVIAFSAALRVQEMAIRMALGSQRSRILGLVFTSAAKLAIAGCILGLLGAAAASQLLHSFLFGVSPFDPLVLLLAAVFVLMLSLLAAYLPARRAASINPMKALRTD